MPAEAAEKIDTAIIQRAVIWSLRYLLDPKRGAGKLPTIGEIKQQFPQIISIDQIENWIRNLAGKANIEEVLKDSQKVTDVLERLTEESQTTKESATRVPYNRPATPPPAKKVSALGVLAELESIEPILKKHRQEVAGKISQSLQQQVEAILPKVTKGLEKDQIPQVAQEIAAETARETLENVAKIQDLSQINQVLADSLTQSIIAHPQIQKIKTTQEKLYAQSFEETKDAAQTNAQVLEKAAVLGSIAQVAGLKKPDQHALEFISDQVEQTIETQAPLTPPATQSYLTGALGTYLVTYVDNFERTLAPSLSKGQIPSFNELLKIKDAVHNQTVAQISVNVLKDKEGKVIEAKIGFKPIAEHISTIMGLRPLSATKAEELGLGGAQPKALTFAKAGGRVGFGVGLILNSPARQQEAYHSLLAYDKPRLEKSINQLNGKIRALKEQRALSYPDRKQLLNYQRQLDNFNRVKTFSVRQPKRFKTYLEYFNRLSWASPTAWSTTEALTGQYQGLTVPRSLATNPGFLAGRAFGSLSFGLGPGNFNFGRPQLPSIGMGKSLSARTSVGLVAAGVASSIMGRIVKGGAAVFGGLFLYFLGLGQAAVTGFVIGAAIGGTVGTAVGAYLGFQIGVALAPFTFGLSIPFFTVLGALGGGFIGGAIGGLVGGLIALGIAAGSATMVSMGIGAGIGGLVGAGVGGTIGFALGSLTGPFAPILAPLGAFVGGTIGAAIGALAGAAVGYLFGNYVLPAFRGMFDVIGSAFSGTAGAGAGALGAVGSFFTGLASGIWGGVTGAAGATFGFLSSATNFIVGGLSSLSIPASAAAIPVVGSISAVAIGSTIVGIVTVTAFSVAETDRPVVVIPGENEFFTLTKTADKTHLTNPPPNKDLTFTITLTAKDRDLESVQVTDQIKVQTKSSSFTPPISPVYCPTTIPASGNCTYTFTIVVDPNFKDSVIINTVTAKATPTGQPEVTDSVVTTVTVGNPPAQCPRGWPAIGDISQGAEGASSHADEVYGGYEAIDIAQGVGNDVYATVEGTVDLIYTKGGNTLDQRIRVRPTSCAGLSTVNYWHLSAVSVSEGDTVTWSQKIGETGDAGSGPHMHYQFNEITDRSFKIAPPYIPQAVSRTCNSITDCGVNIPSAP